MSFHQGDIIVRDDTTYPEGALIVDGFDHEGNLLAHPMGGGLQLIIPAAELPRFGVADELEQTPVFRRASFAIEGIGEEFTGWCDGRHWNGWAMPRFEFAQAEKVAAALDPKSGRYDRASDAFTTMTAETRRQMRGS